MPVAAVLDVNRRGHVEQQGARPPPPPAGIDDLTLTQGRIAAALDNRACRLTD